MLARQTTHIYRHERKWVEVILFEQPKVGIQILIIVREPVCDECWKSDIKAFIEEERYWGTKLNRSLEQAQTRLLLREQQGEQQKDRERELLREWERELLRARERERKSDIELWVASQLILQSLIMVLLSRSSARVPFWKRRLKGCAVCMPWAVPPVLLVLWIVVWMFRASPSVTRFQSENPSIEPRVTPDTASILAENIVPHYPIGSHKSDPWFLEIDDSFSLPNFEISNDFGLESLFDSPLDLDFHNDVYTRIISQPSYGFDSPSNLLPSIEPSPKAVAPVQEVMSGTSRGPAMPQPSRFANIQPSPNNMQSFEPQNSRTTSSSTLTRSHGRVPCAECDRTFPTQRDRDRHDIAVHKRLQPYACTVTQCGKKFSRADNLKRHKERCHNGFQNPNGESSQTQLGLPESLRPTSRAGRKRRRDQSTDDDGVPEATRPFPRDHKRPSLEEMEHRQSRLEIRLKEEQRMRAEAEREFQQERQRRLEVEERLKAKDALEENMKTLANEMRALRDNPDMAFGTRH